MLNSKFSPFVGLFLRDNKLFLIFSHQPAQGIEKANSLLLVDNWVRSLDMLLSLNINFF